MLYHSLLAYLSKRQWPKKRSYAFWNTKFFIKLAKKIFFDKKYTVDLEVLEYAFIKRTHANTRRVILLNVLELLPLNVLLASNEEKSKSMISFKQDIYYYYFLYKALRRELEYKESNLSGLNNFFKDQTAKIFTNPQQQIIESNDLLLDFEFIDFVTILRTKRSFYF